MLAAAAARKHGIDNIRESAQAASAAWPANRRALGEAGETLALAQTVANILGSSVETFERLVAGSVPAGGEWNSNWRREKAFRFRSRLGARALS